MNILITCPCGRTFHGSTYDRHCPMCEENIEDGRDYEVEEEDEE